ncbi:DUF6152 family protein [Limibaculum sp. FT325]|uniref:DUF6152 family protein n=1 Tax=Thermohalobaculum sediminis TaxID=2939436 RepID=UPI0020BF933D|nr:DUF6152 family protein [Limibaculum sediminis]MCL5778428.1 DUF6152 family protein [Limibaculum sediminis]
MTIRQILAACALAALSLATPGTAPAHHGWSWTTGQNIDLTGVIRKASLGLPHGILEVDVEGEVWSVEVGQPWRNERAGIPDGAMAEGVEIRVIGEPSADISDRRIKAERLTIGDVEYQLYPGRD